MPVGRPRTFDMAKALDRALKAFWRKGYEGATLSERTPAMRATRRGAYAAFGNQGALSCKALDLYAEGPAAYVREALDGPAARSVVARLLQGTVGLLSDSRKPRGC